MTFVLILQVPFQLHQTNMGLLDSFVQYKFVKKYTLKKIKITSRRKTRVIKEKQREDKQQPTTRFIQKVNTDNKNPKIPGIIESALGD